MSYLELKLTQTPGADQLRRLRINAGGGNEPEVAEKGWAYPHDASDTMPLLKVWGAEEVGEFVPVSCGCKAIGYRFPNGEFFAVVVEQTDEDFLPYPEKWLVVRFEDIELCQLEWLSRTPDFRKFCGWVFERLKNERVNGYLSLMVNTVLGQTPVVPELLEVAARAVRSLLLAARPCLDSAACHAAELLLLMAESCDENADFKRIRERVEEIAPRFIPPGARRL